MGCPTSGRAARGWNHGHPRSIAAGDVTARDVFREYLSRVVRVALTGITATYFFFVFFFLAATTHHDVSLPSLFFSFPVAILFQALFDLEATNNELKTELRDLYINSAQEVDVNGGRTAIVIHVSPHHEAYKVPPPPLYFSPCIVFPAGGLFCFIFIFYF